MVSKLEVGDRRSIGMVQGRRYDRSQHQKASTGEGRGEH